MVCNTPAFQLKFRAQTGSVGCLKWEKRHWLLRKHQRMRDRKRVGSQQRSLLPLNFASSWETSASRERGFKIIAELKQDLETFFRR